MAEEQLLYRYRTLKHIFEFKELERQEIYFAPTEQVNDPMEGHKIIVFNGDKIVWKNLFRHYIMCLFEISIINDICRNRANNNDWNISDIHYKSIGSFNNNVYLQYLLSLLYDEFFDIFNDEINKISNERKYISVDELAIYLSDILSFIIELIDYIVSNKTKKINDDKKNLTKKDFNTSIDFFIENYNDDKKVFEFIHSKKTTIKIIETSNYIATRFVNDYIKTLKKLVSANELIACFSDNADNFLMWSHYADSHKGICLIFNTIEHNNLPSILLSEHNTKSYNYYAFYKVKYELYNQSINFFSNIHSTTQSIYRDFWYIDNYLIPEGSKSMFYHEDTYDIFDEESIKKYNKNNKFFNQYLEKVTFQILFKLDYWKDEKEYRLVTFDFINQIQNINGKIYKYNFDSLNGIIFGTNTPFEEKISIINIIKNKCIKENRKNFNFYEMQIDETSGKLIQIPLKIDLSIQGAITEHNNE